MTLLRRKTRNGPAETQGPAVRDTTAGSGPTATDAGAADADADSEGEPDVRGSRSRLAGRWRPAAVAAAVALLLLGGSAFFYGAHRLRATPSAQNRALTDTATTERVSGDVSDGLARIFSYTPTGADATARSARTVLGGKAARQYGDLFAQLRANLETQKITLNTRAVRTGVIELDGDTARLLVLLDQTSRRDGGATTSAAAQLTVTAQFQENRWQIVDIKTR
ncbi:hypothetical protein OG730_03960 [Streptomyces sp. NBC_01298]|uniref:hypothetical protein n=1 Tax=Streptomyces sp. NBC_01298 TaxID=2903817 RepID=UPI002E0FBA5D|nr:hypothetical protein OG730_03960 [Streptomyces sp. NBC_01298]